MSELRKAKEMLVSEISEKIQDSKSVYLFEYLGLTVSEITKLRNELRSEGNELKIYKNRLIKLAARQAGIAGLDDALLGPNAIVFSNQDEVSGARIVAQHSKGKDFIKFKAGIFEGKVIDADFAKELSLIPSRETLLTQIATGLLQPLQQIAIGLNMLEASHVAKAGKAKEETKLETKDLQAEESKKEVKPKVKIEPTSKVKEGIKPETEIKEKTTPEIETKLTEEVKEEANSELEAKSVKEPKKEVKEDAKTSIKKGEENG